MLILASEIQEKLSNNREALLEVFPDLQERLSPEVICRGIFIEVGRYECGTYYLKGQTKKYDLRGITQAVKVLNVIKEKEADE